MTLFVTEHTAWTPYRQLPLNQAPLVAYALSTTLAGSTVSATLQAGTKYVRVTADQGMYLNNSTTSGTLSLTSTNSFRVAPNGPGEFFSVSTSFRLQAAST